MITKRIDQSEGHLITDLFNSYRMFYGQPSDTVGAGKYLDDRLQANQSVIFAVFAGNAPTGQPIGFTQLYPLYSSVGMTRNWILNDLFVDPAHRDKGAGTILIRAAEQFANKSGASFLQLETAQDNYRAQQLYEHIGFRRQLPNSNFYVYKLEILTPMLP